MQEPNVMAMAVLVDPRRLDDLDFVEAMIDSVCAELAHLVGSGYHAELTAFERGLVSMGMCGEQYVARSRRVLVDTMRLGLSDRDALSSCVHHLGVWAGLLDRRR